MRLNFDWWTWLTTILIALFITLFMCGCHTTRYVPVETIVKDTATYAHWDSIVNERVKVVRDSLLSYHWEQSKKEVKDSTYVKENVRERVDLDGKVIGRDSTHIEIRYIESKESKELRDSIDHLRELSDKANAYKAQRDSLSRVLDKEKGKTIYVEKELKGMDLLYFRLGKFLFWLLAIMLFGSLAIYLLKRKLHKIL